MRKSMLAGALALVALLTVALDPAMACGRRGGGRFGGGGGFNNGGCYNGGYYGGYYNGGVIYGGYTPYYQPSVEEIPQLTQPVPVEPGTGSAPTAPIQVRDQYGRIYYLVPESQYKKMQPQKEKEK